MANAPRILAFAGSTRSGSFNKKLVKIAVAGARKAGAEVTYLELRDYPLPLYDGDLEESEGLPANARKLKDIFLAHRGLLIASPEYNSSISGVLKNAIDWVSRPAPGEAPLGCFLGKVAALLSTSPGSLGGLRGLIHLRSILGNIKVLVLPDQVSVPQAAGAFEENGSLKDARKQEAAEKLGETLAEILKRLG
jgi:chromate reductase